MKQHLCIYHGGCDDGFAAAWCVRHATGDLFEFYAGRYQDEPPDVTGKHVLLVDFSYKRPVMVEMARKAKSVMVLDHHKSAAEDLAGFPELAATAPVVWRQNELEFHKHGIATKFDMERSGAGLAWDFLHGDRARPTFIDYIEDRDLWRKKLPYGDEFTIALRSYPQDFNVWDGLVGRVGELIAEGKTLQRYYRLRVEEMKAAAYPAMIAGNRCMISNAPYFAASEVAGELALGEAVKFGATYYQAERDKWTYSLRSRGDFDVSEIAKQYGGGGHKNAAGFSVSFPVHTAP